MKNQKDDFNVACITPTVCVGNIATNQKNIIDCLTKAKSQSIDLAVLPLNIISGDILDMRFFPAITKAVIHALRAIAKAVDIPTVIGFPYMQFDCAAFIDKNKVQGFCIISNNKHQTNEGAFADFPFKHKSSFAIGDKKLVVCGVDALNSTSLSLNKNDIIAIPCAYPAFMGGFAHKQIEACTLSKANDGCLVALSCIGKGESTYKYVRSGDKIISFDGKIIGASSLDRHQMIVCDYKNPIDCDIDKYKNNIPSYIPQDYNEVFDIISCGIYGRMNESNNKSVILGLSGGLDSACVLLCAVWCFEKYGLDKKNIIAVCMPSAPSTARTKDNAMILIERLGVTGLNFDILGSVKKHLKRLGHQKKDVVYENTQARERAKILLDLSNKFGALLLGTSDMSESALGFSTYGGDLLAHYNPISSLTKTAIRVLLNQFAGTYAHKYTSKNKADTSLKDCVLDIIATPISPELIKGQQTEKILGPYILHEFFLLRLLAYKESAAQIVAAAQKEFSQYKTGIKKYYRLFINRFFKNRFKAAFACDGIRLSEFDLGAFELNWSFDKSLWDI